MKKDCARRLKIITKSEMKAKNKIKSIRALVVPVLR
jgi:hypothetical protein